MEFKVIGQTAASDPGNGCMRFNTAAQSDASQLYFDQLSVGNIDVTSVLAALAPGDVLEFQQKDDVAVTASYFVLNEATDNGGWFTIDVEPDTSAGLPIPGNKGAIITINSPAAGGAAAMVTVTIPAGESVSSSADLTGACLAMILAPSELDAGSAGRLNIGFQVSADGNEFCDLVDASANEVLRTVLAGCAINVPTDLTVAPMYLRIRSGPVDNPVIQTADRVFTLLTI